MKKTFILSFVALATTMASFAHAENIGCTYQGQATGINNAQLIEKVFNKELQSDMRVHVVGKIERVYPSLPEVPQVAEHALTIEENGKKMTLFATLRDFSAINPAGTSINDLHVGKEVELCGYVHIMPVEGRLVSIPMETGVRATAGRLHSDFTGRHPFEDGFIKIDDKYYGISSR